MAETSERAAQREPGPRSGPGPVGARVVGRVRRPLHFLWGRGFRMVAVLDALALFGSMVLIALVRYGWEWPTYPRSHYWVGFSVATGIHLTVAYFFGLYEREPRLGYRAWLPRATMATLVAVGFDGLGYVLLDRYLMPRLNLAVLVVAASLLLSLNRRISRRLWVRRNGPPRVVLVGPPDDIEMARRHLADSDRDAEVVASLPDGRHLAEVVAEVEATDVLLLGTDTLPAVFPEPLTSLEARGVGVLQRVSAQETLLGLQAVRGVAGMPFVKLRAHAMPAYKARLKRLLDLCVLACLAPVAVLALVTTGVYVLARAGRPILYRQNRVGRDGQIFKMVKFRTMVPGAEAATGAVQADRRDPRIVAGLGWLRETRLDELPQLWHVLRGEMSIVGPRPERPELIAGFSELVPGYARRHETPPGLTGLAQVAGHYSTDPAYKLGHDLQYLVNWSPVLDLQIMARTLVVVLMRRL